MMHAEGQSEGDCPLELLAKKELKQPAQCREQLIVRMQPVIMIHYSG